MNRGDLWEAFKYYSGMVVFYLVVAVTLFVVLRRSGVEAALVGMFR